MERTTKHWTYFLPEAGSIKIHGDDLISLCLKRDELERQVSLLNHLIKDSEESLFNTAQKDWTIEEITEAKQKAKETT